MLALPLLQVSLPRHIPLAADPLRPLPPLVSGDATGCRRTKLWELSTNLHCSVIGTCLSTSELRQFFSKVGDPAAKTASEHRLHSSGVQAASRHDAIGKRLNKAIDRRHEAMIKRLAKAATTDDLRLFWVAALDAGEVAGAYWAVLTHPVTDRALIQDVFGEVHMLSHLVGTSNRLDLARLRKLERDLGDRDETIARQQARLHAGALERADLQRRIETCEAEKRSSGANDATPSKGSSDENLASAARWRLEAERHHADSLLASLREAERRACAAGERAAELEKREAMLTRELAILEESLCGDERGREIGRLDGRKLLYVGGRPRLAEQLRSFVTERGGVLLTHDGGVEHNAALLPGLVSQAHIAFIPIDCVSHAAAGQVKKLCRDLAKPFVPLRSASLSSFVAAVADQLTVATEALSKGSA